jgi:riboflavin kinase/FMN adenylyltransferase
MSMELITGTADFQLHKPSVSAIGKFDGVHLGHQRLLQVLLEQKKQGLQAAIFTFDPSPAELFSGKKIPGLSTKEEKRELFEKAGVDVLIEFPLTKESAAMAPEDFVRDVLSRRMQAECVVAGSDVSFGAGGAGGIAMLQHMAPELGYTFRVVDKVTVDKAVVSSTRIRNAVEDGNMEDAAKLLGSPYSISGTVARGNAIGRTIDMPTLNVAFPAEKVIPPFGVYYSKVYVEDTGKSYHGITNIGRKPTVGNYDTGAETYLYDFDGDLYDHRIKVELLSFKRPEKKFENLEALKKQLQADKEAGREYFEKNNDL